ncbi:MAG: RNA methyltransferase, partial [Betaproteobacteria bacterium]|nr:RNA methyltransferase [Betaproteobacteria bacterium]
MSVIRSRENARLKAWARLADDPRERRKQGMALLEGVHLVESYIATGRMPACLIVAESALVHPEVTILMARAGGTPFVLADALFKR